MAEFEGVDALLTEEVTALAAAFGVELVEVARGQDAPPSAAAPIVGAISFHGDTLSGAITCAAPAATWRALAPWAAEGDFEKPSDYDDYAAEVSNLFAGKLKLALSRKRVVITLGLPRSAVAAPIARHRWHTLRTPAGAELHVRFEAAFEDTFALDDDAPPVSIPGGFMLF